MEWMHTHHISSKPLTIGEKLAMTEKLKEAIQEENKKKQEEANKKFHGNQHCTVFPPIGVQTTSSRSTWTDNQIAKKAGVGVGSVARYNKVMNSDEINIYPLFTAAYRSKKSYKYL